MSAEQPPDAPPPRRYVVMAVKLAVSVALLAFLFSRIDVARLWASARQASMPWLARRARASTSATCWRSTWRWHLLLEAQDVDVAPRHAVRLVPGRASSSTISCRATSAATSSASATPRARADRRRWRRPSSWSIAARPDGAGAGRGARRDARATGAPSVMARSPLWPSWFWAAASWFWAVFVAGARHDARARRAGRASDACCSR